MIKIHKISFIHYLVHIYNKIDAFVLFFFATFIPSCIVFYRMNHIKLSVSEQMPERRETGEEAKLTEKLR